jgi:hypothetical protein
MSYLSRRYREIREEEERRANPVYDFQSHEFLQPGRTDKWLAAEDPRIISKRRTWYESVNYLGRGG